LSAAKNGAKNWRCGSAAALADATAFLEHGANGFGKRFQSIYMADGREAG
jgi:hypothetical protein